MFHTDELVHKIGSMFSAEGDDFSDDLVQLEGKRITKVGFLPKVDDGGLSIDYVDGEVKRRIVFGYTELGVWIYWHGVVGEPNFEDLLKERIGKFMDSDDYCVCEGVKLVQQPCDRSFRIVAGDKSIVISCSEARRFPKTLRGMFLDISAVRVDDLLMQLAFWSLS